jgi:two-component system response regulator PilR (NtrC family)
LVDHFLNKVTGGKGRKYMASESMKLLMHYRWPGNVRELENAVERLAIMTTGETICTEHIAGSLSNIQPSSALIPSDIPDSGIDLEAILNHTEKTLLYKAMEKTGGVKTEAAKLLGLSFRSFRHRLQKHEAV